MWYEQKIYEESPTTWKDVRPPIFCYYHQEQSARSDRGESNCDERTPGGDAAIGPQGGDAAIGPQEKSHGQATKLPHEGHLQQEEPGPRLPVDIFHSAEDEDDYWQVGFPRGYVVLTRVHVRPRNTFFSPTDTELPAGFNVEDLEDTQYTEVHPEERRIAPHTVTDTWHTPVVTPYYWQGSTSADHIAEQMDQQKRPSRERFPSATCTQSQESQSRSTLTLI